MKYVALRIAAAALTPLLVLHPQAAHCATPAPAAQMPHISITSVGKGPAIVLIPGLATPRAVWDAVVPELARTHRVLLVQVNGFAGEDPGANTKPGLLKGAVADLDGYLVANRVKDAKIVGHSMGGVIALMFARDHPDHVSQIMVVDALPFFAVLMAPPGVNPTVAMVEPQAAKMRDTVAAKYGMPLDPASAEAQTKGLALKPDSIVKMKQRGMGPDPRVTAEGLYEDLTSDLRPDIAKITTPITLVYPWNAGGPTKPMADAFYRAQYATAPHIIYVDIGDSAHFVMLDQPAAFAAALTGFAG